MTSPSELHKQIAAGKFKPAYYFFGTEDYRIAEAEKFIARQFLPDRQLITNYRKLDGKKTSCADLLAELSNLPMIGERQVFTVSDFQSYSPTEIEQVLRLLSPADPTRIVIFTSPSAKTPKKNSSFFLTVSKVAVPVEFRKLTDRETSGLISRQLREAEIKIDPEALKLLTELIAGNRGAIDAEVAKLVNYKEKGDTVTVDDVKKMAAGYEMFNIFQVADHVVAGETKKVLRMIESLLAGGNSPATITTLLQQHFISLYLVKNGKSPLGRRGFLVPKLSEQAREYDNNQLEQIIVEIAATDAELRRQRLKPAMALEMLTLRLTGQSKQVDE
jgi:DNA polymerase-3 subunit delta